MATNSRLPQTEALIQKSIAELSDFLEFVPAEEHHNWLRQLHSHYSEKFLQDNNRIWSTASILIPLSLAGLATVKDAPPLSVIPIALASISLMLFWVIFAEHHRAFQNRSSAYIQAIERHIHIHFVPGKADGHPITKIGNVQTIRWAMFYLIVLIWTLALVFSAL
ncbi:hypothetical protein IM792_06170 [Mucilaginibacter sp. JRF]|uniref:hypothetical protein n=1 Tax=Mucilaginibacter sp. JRF TaxID=2780088 RepID=UPI00187F95B6|nr:hypothetical protein [Mucilaginibacter sp. JRF]MBE9584029.1 hypothetical protein [Mucilaginibacter sp. JRF]